jgi:gamma-glutamylputrescine oxidase
MSTTDPIYGPTWYAETMVPTPEREPLVHDFDVDVCIIGGGLAGLTVARELARRGWSVAVLEADRVAASASGRNGGMVLPGFAEHPESIVERVGLDRAKALWALSLDGVDYVRDAIEESRMPGVDPVDGWLYVQRAEGMERAEHAAGLLRTFETEVEIWDIDQVRDVLRTEAYFQALHFPDAFHIHPLNYALGLAAAAEADGARIFERTRALAIDPAGVRKRVDTSWGRLRAHHVVLAGSAHLSPLFPLVADAVLPVVTYLATTAPLGERLREAIAYPGAVVDTRGVPGYFRIVGGDRLMWGGRVATRAASPQRVARAMQRHIGKVFPQLRDVEISHAWSGTMGYAMHRMPLIGEISPGLWVATAFGGHGLNTSAMAGDLIARAIMDGDDRWRLFSSYDLVWAAGKAGLAARRATYWFMQAQDWIDEKVARRRYISRLRHQRIAASVADEAKRNVAAAHARIATERVAQRHAEAGRLIAEEKAQQAAAEAARLAALEAERQAAEAARFAAAEAQRLASAQEAELAAQASRQAAEEAERIAAEAVRHAQEEAERLATTHAARVAAEAAEQRAGEEETAEETAVRAATGKAARAARRKETRNKRRTEARQRKLDAGTGARDGSPGGDEPASDPVASAPATTEMEDASTPASGQAAESARRGKRKRGTARQ